MRDEVERSALVDHCRIGSLEKQGRGYRLHQGDHCRIGSLENGLGEIFDTGADHCRIGSLENVKPYS